MSKKTPKKTSKKSTASKSKTFKNVLIVIGVSPNKDGKPSRLMINRLRKAIQLNNKNKYSKIILSGGRIGYPVPSAEIMRIMSLHHLPQDKIVVEPNSKNLLHNALFCWNIIKEKSPKNITIVTSDWNMRRAKYIFTNTYKHMGVSLNFESCNDQIDMIEKTFRTVKELILLAKLKIFGIK